jgi:hypothetical protein
MVIAENVWRKTFFIRKEHVVIMAGKRVKPKECSLIFCGSQKFKKSFSGCVQRSESESKTHLLLPWFISWREHFLAGDGSFWRQKPCKFNKSQIYIITHGLWCGGGIVLYTAYKILEGTTRSFEIVEQERGQL